MLRLAWLPIPQHVFSGPHWQVGSSWFREKLSPANRNKGYPGEQISRKLSPANWMQGVTAISWKISRFWAPRLQNSRNRWAKKWGPTCDRDISNSGIYTTAIYRAYTVSPLLMHWRYCSLALSHRSVLYTISLWWDWSQSMIWKYVHTSPYLLYTKVQFFISHAPN